MRGPHAVRPTGVAASPRSAPASCHRVSQVEFRVEQVIPGPLAAVEDAFVDPGFLARLAELPSFAGVELLDQQVDGGVVRQRVHYAFVGELSPAVTAIVDPAKLSWVEESVHDRTAHRADCRI